MSHTPEAFPFRGGRRYFEIYDLHSVAVLKHLNEANVLHYAVRQFARPVAGECYCGSIAQHHKENDTYQHITLNTAVVFRRTGDDRFSNEIYTVNLFSFYTYVLFVF